MTTKPELPEPDIVDKHYQRLYYTATQMHEYAARVCADKDAEIETMNTTITWATTHIEAIIAERVWTDKDGQERKSMDVEDMARLHIEGGAKCQQ